MTKPLHIGIIGAGAIAQFGHIPGFQKLTDVHVTAVCDTNIERAREVAAKFNIPHVYEDYREIIAHPAINAVTVGLPNALHATVTQQALAAGKHVMCEKPLATTVADGEAMVTAAEQADRILALNMHQRVRSDTQLLRKTIADGGLGQIHYMHIRMMRRNGIPGFGSWFTQRELSGGGVLMDLGVHVVDLAMWLLDFPQVVAVRGETRAIHGPRGRGLGGWGVDHMHNGAFEVEDFASLHLRLANGGLITTEVSWAMYGDNENRVQVVGDEGGADIFPELHNQSPMRLFRDEHGISMDVYPHIPRLAGSDWDRSMANFVEAIRNEDRPPATGAEGLTVLKLLDTAYRSSTERKELDIIL
ncbi:MAG: Gfo/Idh/MocA family oxidoreductase [Chloroflexota bacterium]